MWFGAFTLLYGVRLLARSDVIAATLPLNPATFDYIDISITYTILIPAALLLRAIFGAGPRRLLSISGRRT